MKLVPGSHLRAHSGSANNRLTLQLPVMVPPGIEFRVANETRTYTPGKAFIFDDSFEHEVWHRGTEDRYVLYMTVHHPDLGLDLVPGKDYEWQLRQVEKKMLALGLIDADEFISDEDWNEEYGEEPSDNDEDFADDRQDASSDELTHQEL